MQSFNFIDVINREKYYLFFDITMAIYVSYSLAQTVCTIKFLSTLYSSSEDQAANCIHFLFEQDCIITLNIYFCVW